MGDQMGKKIQCCNLVLAAVTSYGQLAEGLSAPDLRDLNDAFAAALKIVEPAIEKAARQYIDR